MIRSAAPIAATIILAMAIPALAAPTAGETESKQPDPVKLLVGRLDLEKYKATIKGLTKFGDRRQGTDRNRAAVDWIEAQLKSYGCSNISRIKYQYSPTETRRPSGPLRRMPRKAAAVFAGCAAPRASIQTRNCSLTRSCAR
jgi:hypothetical protein